MPIPLLACMVATAAYYHLPPRVRLTGDGCFNIAAAGAILRAYLDEAHGDLMTAVGYYHSHRPALHQAYRQRVLQAATILFVTSGQPRN